MSTKVKQLLDIRELRNVVEAQTLELERLARDSRAHLEFVDAVIDAYESELVDSLICDVAVAPQFS